MALLKKNQSLERRRNLSRLELLIISQSGFLLRQTATEDEMNGRTKSQRTKKKKKVKANRSGAVDKQQALLADDKSFISETPYTSYAECKDPEREDAVIPFKGMSSKLLVCPDIF
jgi:hypothetical protein